MEVGIMAAVWLLVVMVVKDRGETLKTVAFGITGVASAVVIFWLLESVFWWALGVSAVLILAHALYRDPAHNPVKEGGEASSAGEGAEAAATNGTQPPESEIV